MRKLAPLAFSMIATFVAGTSVAATNATTSPVTPTEQMTSPTVPANTNNPQGLSYSDKSNTSPGTNAKMDDKNAMSGTDPAVETRNEKARAKKAKMAKATDPSMMKTDPSMMKTTPIDSTNGAAAKSTTGVSGGQ